MPNDAALFSRSLAASDDVNRDPIVLTVKDGLSQPKISVDDSLATLKSAYNSSRDEMISSKQRTERLVFTERDPNAEREEQSIRTQLRDLELQRVDIYKALLEEKVNQTEGNERLLALNKKKNALSNKLSLIDDEQEQFQRQLKAMQDKHDEFAASLQKLYDDEQHFKERAETLADEKAALAKRLAEVSAAHTEAANTLAQLAARRSNLSKSVDQMKVDADIYSRQLQDLDQDRRHIGDQYKTLLNEEEHMVSQVKDFGTSRHHLCKTLKDLNREIGDARAKLNMAAEPDPVPFAVYRPDPKPVSNYVEQPIVRRPVREYRKPPTSVYPDGYKGEAPPRVTPIEAPVVARGVLNRSHARQVPIMECEEELVVLPASGAGSSKAVAAPTTGGSLVAGQLTTQDKTGTYRTSYEISVSEPAKQAYPTPYSGSGRPQSAIGAKSSGMGGTKQWDRPQSAWSQRNNTYERAYGRRLW